MFQSSLRAIGLGALLFAANTAFAAAGTYSLKGDSSTVHFVSVKNTVVAEVHDFTKLSGTIDDKGLATVIIDLASADTHIDIRNQRLDSMLFHVEHFPSAIVSTQLDPELLKNLKAGEELSKTLNLNVAFHGKQKTYAVPMRIAVLANGIIQASTEAPILLNAVDFALEGGLEKLRDIAKLKAISPIVAVTATLVFQAK